MEYYVALCAQQAVDEVNIHSFYPLNNILYFFFCFVLPFNSCASIIHDTWCIVDWETM